MRFNLFGPTSRNRRFILHFLLSCIATLIFYLEFLCYSLLPSYWRKSALMLHSDTTSAEILRVLLVADPQLQGFRNEPAGIIGAITRSDADSYLSRTYRQAFHYATPHLVVFLGDLLDEGLIANDADYKQYVDRFRSIFFLNDAKVIYTPGDNDIGGESEPVSASNLKRFRKFFQSDVENAFWHNHIGFVEVNYLTREFEELSISGYTGIPVIQLSHFPRHQEKHQDLQNPALILSAHNHKAGWNEWPTSEDHEAVREKTDKEITGLITIDLGSSSGTLHEFIVPTCSYRMGVPEMAYGIMIIDLSTKKLVYTTLWLPSRYTHLTVYLATTIIFCLGFIALFTINSYLRKRHNGTFCY